MGARKVEFEGIDAEVLTTFDDLDPGVLAKFFHDRRDEHAIGVAVFYFLEFVDPDIKRTIAD